MKNPALLLIASGETSPDIRYAAGFSTPDEFILFGVDGVLCAVMSPLEYDRARANAAPDCQVLAESELGGPDRMAVFREIVRRFRIDGFIVPENFPLLWADKLRAAGIPVETRAGTFFPEREFKSKEEADKIRECEKGAAAGFFRAREVLGEASVGKNGMLVRDGEPLTSETLRAEIDAAMLRSGMLPTGTICAGGSQSARPHETGSGALYAGTPIVLDIFPKSQTTGYWGDMTRTVVKGKAPEIVRRAHRAVCEAKKRAISLLGIGAIPAEIHRAADAVLQKHGFFTGIGNAGHFGFFHGLGHGVGLEIHEAPRLSPGNVRPLRGGEIVTVEPGLYYPEWGGVRQEDLLWLSPDGETVDFTEVDDRLEIE
ncbi:MAG: M24 family metallopeptidase [Victivallaceae bacterium]|nr:M24 family metallopeptidase [Victivallaceae bacterium]